MLDVLRPPSSGFRASLETAPPREPLLRDPLLAVPLLLPVVLLALDSSWAYGIPLRDAWIYYGLFLYPEQLTRALGTSYYSARLSVILPGWAAHELLPLLAANLLLHLGLFWVAALSFYTVCKLELGRGAALLSTLALGCHPFFLLAIGWNYVDGFGITYFLAALLFLVLARHRRAWRICLVLAGGAATALVTANVFYVVYLPFLLAYFLAGSRAAARPPLLRSALLAAAGAAATFAVFGAAYRVLGGPFFYLGPSLRFSRRRLAAPSNPFWHPVLSWLPDATWLVLPAAVCLGAAVLLVRLRREPDAGPRRFLVFSQLQLLVFAAMMGSLQLWAGVAVLEHVFYASLLLPVTFLALAGQIAELLRRGVSPRQWAVLAGAAAAFALPWIVPLDILRFRPALGAPVVLAGLTALGLSLVLWLGVAGCRAVCTAMACLAVSQLLAWGLSPFPYSFDTLGGDARSLFVQVARSVSLIEAHGRPRLWYFLGDPDDGVFYDLVASAFLFCPSLVSADFPALHEGRRTCDGVEVRPGLRIAVLSSEPEAFAKADAALRGLGLSARLLSRREVPGPVPGAAVTFLEVRAGGPA